MRSIQYIGERQASLGVGCKDSGKIACEWVCKRQRALENNADIVLSSKKAFEVKLKGIEEEIEDSTR